MSTKQKSGGVVSLTQAKKSKAKPNVPEKPAEPKPSLIVENKNREEQVRNLAEAWGLGHNSDSDDDDDKRHRYEPDVEEVHGSAGLGAAKPAKAKVDETSLEHRVEAAKAKRLKTIAAQKVPELSVWHASEDGEDDDTALTKSHTIKNKRAQRFKRAYDNVDSGTIHPLAATKDK